MIFPYPLQLSPPLGGGGLPSDCRQTVWLAKTTMVGLQHGEKKFENMFIVTVEPF